MSQERAQTFRLRSTSRSFIDVNDGLGFIACFQARRAVKKSLDIHDEMLKIEPSISTPDEIGSRIPCSTVEMLIRFLRSVLVDDLSIIFWQEYPI